MQPDKARKQAHEKADANKAEREQQNRERESRKIGDTLKARTDTLFNTWALKEDPRLKLYERNVSKPTSRHGIARFLPGFKQMSSEQRTALPVQLGESKTPAGEHLSRAGIMQKEKAMPGKPAPAKNVERVRFLVVERDDGGNRIGLEQELAVLEDGVLTVSEKREKDEVVVSSENDETLILVNEMLDKFEKQAQGPKVPAGL